MSEELPKDVSAWLNSERAKEDGKQWESQYLCKPVLPDRSYRDGYMSRERGETFLNNPYSPADADDYKAWRDGWRKASQDIDKALDAREEA